MKEYKKYLNEIFNEGQDGVETQRSDTSWGKLAMELAKHLGEDIDPNSGHGTWTMDDVSFVVHNYHKQGKKAKKAIEEFLGQKGIHHTGRIWKWDVDGNEVWLDVGSRFDPELPVEISVTFKDKE